MAIDKKIFEDGGRDYYYMHRHIAHFEKDEAIAEFKKQKDMQYGLARARYLTNYLKNIKSYTTSDEKGLELLNMSLSDQEAFISNLDQEIVNILNDRVSEVIASKKYQETVGKAYSSLDDFIETKNLKDLDNLFKAITEATSILESKSAVTALLPLLKNYKLSGRNLNELNNFINQQINLIEGQSIKIKNGRTLSVLRSLSKLVSSLNNKSFKKNELQGYLRNIFSTQIGEYLVSLGVKKGLNLFIKNIQNTMVGSKNVKVSPDSELLQYTQLGKQSYKTDNSFKNVTFTLNNGDQVKMTLGLNAKWYKSINNKQTESVAITTEKSFTNRLNQLLKDDKERYYGYNALGLVNEDNSVYAALKAAILARNIDILISGIGEDKDYSQYIVINGEFYSIWQIIQLLEKFNEGSGTTDQFSGRDPVTISATGLSRVAELTEAVKNKRPNIYLAYQRAKEQNQLINNLGLTGHFYFNRFKNLTK